MDNLKKKFNTSKLKFEIWIIMELNKQKPSNVQLNNILKGRANKSSPISEHKDYAIL